jgi:diketogulonate reductase-like aldo/keto reductase
MGADPEGLLSYCKANGIVVEAYSPLGDNTTELITGPLTTSIAHAHNKSSVQVLRCDSVDLPLCRLGTMMS